MFEKLNRYIASFVTLTADEKQVLESAFTFRQMPKKFRLAAEGATARELFFVNTGLIRLYYTKNGTELTGYIFSKGCLPAATTAFYGRCPACKT